MANDLNARNASGYRQWLRDLKYIRQWHIFWTASSIGQQAVAQLTTIPWGHNLAIISKCQSHDHALHCVQQTQVHGLKKMQSLTEKLAEQMAQGNDLDALIRRKLAGVGYEL